jgi:electron transport complex protein RnfD
MLTLSPAPHIHNGDSVRRNMLNVVIAMLPAYLVSLYYFGFGALCVSLISIVSCLLFEFLIQKFILKGKDTLGNMSALVTGMLLAFNLPSNLPWWIVVIGALVAIGIGKMTFGGLGNNPFNPALVGRVFLLISFPAQMTTWPRPVPMNLDFNYKNNYANIISCSAYPQWRQCTQKYAQRGDSHVACLPRIAILLRIWSSLRESHLHNFVPFV